MLMWCVMVVEQVPVGDYVLPLSTADVMKEGLCGVYILCVRVLVFLCVSESCVILWSE